MKTRFKYLALLFAASIMIGISSCSNEEETQDLGTKSVYLKLNRLKPNTYLEEESQSGGSISFEIGHLYFTDNNGVIVKYFTLSYNATHDNNINIGDLTGSGIALNELPPTINNVYIVGNTEVDENGDTIPTSGSMDDVMDMVLTLESQSTFDDIHLFGEGELLAKDGEENKYTCDLTLSPTLARFELKSLEGYGEISEFKVVGIFVDNYYYHGYIGGYCDANDLEDNGTNSNYFTDDSDQYPSELHDIIYNWYDGGIESSSKKVEPAYENVWAYNLFADIYTNGYSYLNPWPRIIIRLTDVKLKDGYEYTEDQFLTIKGIKQSEPSGIIQASDNHGFIKSKAPALFTMEAGKIYKFSNVRFNESNLSPIPNQSAIDVEMSISVVDWEVEEVDAVL